jgi:hypothetical protein
MSVVEKVRRVSAEIVRDAMRVAGRAYSMVRHFLSEDDVSVNLSMFSGDEPSVKEGETGNYRIIITNVTKRPQWARLAIDICKKGDPARANGRHVYFDKRIFLRCRHSQVVKMAYNWKDFAAFEIDGVTVHPNNFRLENRADEGIYFLKAALIGEKNEIFDKLVIAQRLCR